MAELADAPDLGSGVYTCRFDSCYPHQKDRNAIRRFGPFCVVIDYDEAALAKGEKAGKFGEDQT